MIKVIKYDIKSILRIIIVFSALAIAINAVFGTLTLHSSNIANGTSASYFITLCKLNIACYAAFLVIMLGNMWWKVHSDTELYELAGISPLKVGAIRMLAVFVSVTIIAYLLTLCESLIAKEFIKHENGAMQWGITGFLFNYDSLFSIAGMKWTNIFAPVFGGLYAALLFTTSFLFVTLNRRLNNKLLSSFLLAAIIIAVLVINFAVLNKINLMLPSWNINKIGISGLFIERFGNSYSSTGYMLMPNMLNLGLLLYHCLYAALMFSIYSLRRNLI